MKITKKSVGFTLIEIMVAVAILGILMAGIYGLYNSVYNSYLSQNQLSDVEQNARIGIEQMMREIRLVGYNTVGNQIYRATPNDFVFQEVATAITSSSTTTTQSKKIEYYSSNPPSQNILQRGEETQPYYPGAPPPIYPSDGRTTTPLMPTSTLQTVASQVSNLTFTYYDANNVRFDTTSRTDYTSITRVRVQLTAQGNQPSPDKIGVNVGGKIYKQVQVEADIRLRNMGIGQSNAGTTAPAAPTGLVVYDTGNPCGSLNVQWNANTEPALAGYTLYYRTAGTSVPYTSVVVGNVTSAVLTGLTIKNTYSVTIKAYDNVGNYSNYGPVIVSANDTVGGMGVLDTRPNVAPPAAPTSITANAGDKWVKLDWTVSTTTGIPGYNIYRMAWNGTTYAPASPGVLLNTSPVNATTFTDNFPDIPAPNCPLTYKDPHGYQYQIAAVDCSGSGGIGPYSSPVSGTSGTSNTYPKDTASPADPTSFNGAAGTNQVLLSWTNASDPDIFGVLIRSRNGAVNDLAYNTFPSSTTDGRLVYQDSTVVLPTSSGGNADNGLTNNTVYTYTAYSFDKCGNFSGGASSRTVAVPCGDATYPGPPGNPTNFTGSSCGSVHLSWNAPTKNGNGVSFAIMPGDVIGYNIYRCSTAPCTKSNAVGWSGSGTPLNKTVRTTPDYDDATVVAGQTYYYAVTAIDCVLPTPNESTYATTSGGATYIAMTPGGLTQDVYLLYGTSTGGNSSTTVNDTTKSFAAWPAYQNATLRITQGTDAGQLRPIVGNTATTLTIPTFYPWGASLPDNTSQYEIDRPITASGSASSLTRDKVTFYVKNTGAGIIQIRSSDTANITWSNYAGLSKEDYRNSDVNLKMIKVNGTLLWSSVGGVPSGNSVTFTSLGAPLSINGLQNGIPMDLYFVDKFGNPADMQGETINIVMTYGTPNPDGTYTTCTWSTLSAPASPITVPLAPSGSAGQCQQTPAVSCSAGLSASGSNVFQAGTGPVSFYSSSLSAPSGHYVTSATVYYCQQAWSVMTSSPPLPGPCYGTPLTMTITGNNNNSASITGLTPNITESGSPFRIWYYLQITDNLGNIYNVPDSSQYNGVTGFNAYTYDQYDKFNPAFTMSWTSSGTNRNIVVTGSVTDFNGLAVPASGATVMLTFAGNIGNSATVTQSLAAGTNTWTSPNTFGNGEDARVTLTLSKSGFGPNTINICGTYPNGPGSVPLASSVANNTQVSLCP